MEIPERTESALQRLSSRQGKGIGTFLVDLIDETERFDAFDIIDPSDSEERSAATIGIQKGLADYAAERHRSFEEFASELRGKYLAGSAES